MKTTVKVFGDTWKVIVLSVDEYKKKYSDDSAATTEVNIKTIFVCKDSVKKEVITHEIGHAYYKYMLASSLDLTKDQHEELACEILAYYGEEILNKSINVLTKLKQ